MRNVISKKTLADLSEIGIKVSPNVAEVTDDLSDVDYVVCANGWGPMPPFLDNELTHCARCGTRVQHRPDVPPAPKICLSCCGILVREEKA